MPSWTEEDYVKRAAALASESTVTKKTLNDVCEKAAQDDSLNPEEIRTLVRLSNVAMFQHLFKQKDAAGDADRHVEFEVGDPETVIQRLQLAAAQPPQSANIMNDKLAHEVPDMMAAKRRGFEYEAVVEKTATDHEVKPAKKDIATLAMRKLAEEFENRRLQASFRWEEKVAAIHDRFHRAPGYGPSFDNFETDAYAAYGKEAAFELVDLRKGLRLPEKNVSLVDLEKLAEYHAADDSQELALLKEAMDARKDFLRYEDAQAWIAKHMPVVKG